MQSKRQGTTFMVIPCLYSFLLTVLRTLAAEPPINKKRTRTLSRKESGSSTNCMVDGTGLEQQRRRPLPAAETGRSCWGRILIFQSPAKGLRKNQQMQPVRPRRFPTRRNVYRDAGTVWEFFCGGRYRTPWKRPPAFLGCVAQNPGGHWTSSAGWFILGAAKKTEEQGSAEWCRKTG